MYAKHSSLPLIQPTNWKTIKIMMKCSALILKQMELCQFQGTYCGSAQLILGKCALAITVILVSLLQLSIDKVYIMQDQIYKEKVIQQIHIHYIFHVLTGTSGPSPQNLKLVISSVCIVVNVIVAVTVVTIILVCYQKT